MLAKELFLEKINSTELGTLMKWHGIPSSKQGSKQAIVSKMENNQGEKKMANMNRNCMI